MCPECNNELKTKEITDRLSEVVYQEYQKIEIFRAVGELTFINCPADGCGHAFAVSDTVSKFECPKCKNVICVNCGTIYHPGISCDEFRKKITGLKKCPFCGEYSYGGKDMIILDTNLSKRNKVYNSHTKIRK